MDTGNATLKEAFRHHAWATRQLLAFCAQLRPEQVSQPRTTPLAGDHGSILETFDHIVCTDGGYLAALTGHLPAWAHERRLFLDDGTYETHAAIVTGQALHHGSAHREQICAMLRDFGLEPPDLQPWDFADATSRSRWIKAE